MKGWNPVWAVASAANLLLLLPLLFFSSSADRDRCPWLFFSCDRLADSECRIVLRRQCNCTTLIKSLSKEAGVVLQPSDSVIRTECIGLEEEQRLNVSVSTAKHILDGQQSYPVSIAALCDLHSCAPRPAWCPWGPWEPSSSDCRYLITFRRQMRCCHPVSAERLNITCVHSRRVQRLRKPDIPDCLRIRVNGTENRTAPTSSVKKPELNGSGELTYAYLAIGLFICVCFMIAFPYRHIYRMCASDSPDSSNCSTPNLYEQVPMEVQHSQVAPYEETEITVEREPDDLEIEAATKSDDPSPETLLTETSVVEG